MIATLEDIESAIEQLPDEQLPRVAMCVARRQQAMQSTGVFLAYDAAKSNGLREEPTTYGAEPTISNELRDYVTDLNRTVFGLPTLQVWSPEVAPESYPVVEQIAEECRRLNALRR